MNEASAQRPPSRLDQLQWTQGFAALGDAYGSVQPPEQIDAPYLVAFNEQLGSLLNLTAADANSQNFIDTFSGNAVPEGATPFSQVYAGHQFGVWAGQLGDGRAIALGELRDRAGQTWEVQLKGAGKTPYSRFADGRAVLRSTIREYLASAAMAGLGIPTTRALCITGSDAPVYRETVETAAILTRMAPSHVRFGNFEMFFYSRQFDLLGPLADHVIEAHFPQAAALESGPARYRLWVGEVITRTAQLIADWQAVGFCHGVMNTDNMSILGLTLDYGPYGFLDHYDPHWICNHTDTAGRYAYDQQPAVGLWNLGRFVQAILPLLSNEPDEAVAIGQDMLKSYQPEYDAAHQKRMCGKLGLPVANAPGTDNNKMELIDTLLQIMAQDQADFTRSFRALGQVSAKNSATDNIFLDEFKNRDTAAGWLEGWRGCLQQQGNTDDAVRRAAMDAANPKYVLRNYLAQEAIEKAQTGDYSQINELHSLLSNPFDEQPERQRYARLPPPSAALISVSCSS